jgi:hypothetical protein
MLITEENILSMTECIVVTLKTSCPIPEIYWRLFVLIFVLFNDAVNISDTMVGWLMNKRLEANTGQKQIVTRSVGE